MKEQILLFGIKDEKQKLQIRQALIPLRIKLRAVSPEEYHLTLGELVAGTGETPSDAAAAAAASRGQEELPGPMLLLVGLTSSRLDSVLQALRNRRVQIPHKAVLTAHNAAWTPMQLFEELEKERKRFEET